MCVNEDHKEQEPRAAEGTTPQDSTRIGNILFLNNKTNTSEETAVVHKESCILKIFHMSLRSYNCLKQFLGFPKHYLILEIFICVNEESQRARA